MELWHYWLLRPVVMSKPDFCCCYSAVFSEESSLHSDFHTRCAICFRNDRKRLRLRRQRQHGEPHDGRAELHAHVRCREPAGERERSSQRQLPLRRGRPAGQDGAGWADDHLCRQPTTNGTEHGYRDDPLLRQRPADCHTCTCSCAAAQVQVCGGGVRYSAEPPA